MFRHSIHSNRSKTNGMLSPITSVFLLAALAGCTEMGPVENEPVPEEETEVAAIQSAVTTPGLSRIGLTQNGEVFSNSASEQLAFVNTHTRTVRSGFLWETIEPTKDAYQGDDSRWSTLDQHVQKLNRENFDGIILVMGVPTWAAVADAQGVKPCRGVSAANLPEVKQFFKDLTERYDADGYLDGQYNGAPVGRIKYLEMFNEPDRSDEWIYDPNDKWTGGCFGNHADEYVAFLQAAREGIMAAAPDPANRPMMLMGGIAAEPDQGNAHFNFKYNASASNPDFMTTFLALGGWNMIDAFTFHYYEGFHCNRYEYGSLLMHCWDQGTSSAYPPNGTTNGILGKKAHYEARFNALGLPAKPWFVTETGIHSSAAETLWGVPLSEERQADYVLYGMARAIRAGISSTQWFLFKDTDMGLVRNDFSQKPAYNAFKAMADELGEASYAGPPPAGLVQPGSELEYYYFKRADGRYISVYWKNPWPSANASTGITFQANAIRFRRLGGEYIFVDGSSADADPRVGYIKLGSPNTNIATQSDGVRIVEIVR